MSTHILIGDVREQLTTLSDQSVQCCVTSPPYYGLRDYGVDGQIGLEPTLAEYIATMVDVFRGVRRVLRDDGTLWLNIGDSYAAGRGVDKNGNPRSPGILNSHNSGYWIHTAQKNQDWKTRGRGGGLSDMGLKPKDLMMVPARLAIALQDDGWYLRSDIIWFKPNPMPESVRDRPTSSHEHIFLLTKSARYFYDADAVREPLTKANQQSSQPVSDTRERHGMGGGNSGLTQTKRAMISGEHDGRNLRNVWQIATHSFPGAHFATFPPEIPTRCIKAGTSEKGCCSECGAPWVRVVERDNPRLSDEYQSGPHSPKMANSLIGRNDFGSKTGLAKPGWREHGDTTITTTGWSPSCKCNADVAPCVVLDPFLGSGTTLLVADQLGRNGVGIELNESYAEMARQRIYNDAPLFADIA